MQSIWVPLNEHRLVDVGKPAHDTSACPTAPNDEQPHLTIQQFFVQFVGLHALRPKWPPLSRPALSAAISYGSAGSDLRSGRPKPPLPFRRLSRRSGRIPAESYPPLKCLYCSRTKTAILAR